MKNKLNKLLKRCAIIAVILFIIGFVFGVAFSIKEEGKVDLGLALNFGLTFIIIGLLFDSALFFTLSCFWSKKKNEGRDSKE